MAQKSGKIMKKIMENLEKIMEKLYKNHGKITK